MQRLYMQARLTDVMPPQAFKATGDSPYARALRYKWEQFGDFRLFEMSRMASFSHWRARFQPLLVRLLEAQENAKRAPDDPIRAKTFTSAVDDMRALFDEARSTYGLEA